jgi:hypothetical protein
MKETGRGFVWARSLERFVWLGAAEAAVENEIAANGEETLSSPADAADTAADQKRIW